MSLSTFILRKMFGHSDQKRDAGLQTPDDIERKDNILYGTDRRWQLLDLYRPKGTVGKLPTILNIHGGGWTYGDKECYQWYCMNLAQRGFAVVNFTYRLAPEFRFPAALEDTNLVAQWMIDHDEWFDMRHIYGAGDSAGAQMLTMYAAMCTNEAYAALFPFHLARLADGRAFRFEALALNCGVYEFNKKSSRLTKNLMRALLPQGGSEAEMAMINPIPRITADFPRAFVMTANRDTIVGSAAQEPLVRMLKEKGIPFIDKTYGTADHPLNHVFHLNIRDNIFAKACNDNECAFFRLEGSEYVP